MDPKRHFLIAAAVTTGVLFLYGPGALRWMELKIDRMRLQSEIHALKTDNQRLYLEAKRLREDSSYAEAVARRELGLVRPGETVVRLKAPKREARKQSLR